MVKKFVPDRGDIVWLDFDLQHGREIKKTRPALTISPKKYNSKTGLALFMPITSQIKDYPFEIKINSKEITGVILCDQLRSLDWQVRKAKFICTIPKELVTKAINIIKLLID